MKAGRVQASRALALLGLLTLAVCGYAQVQPKDQVPFKGTITGLPDGIVIPTQPPIGIAFTRVPVRGEATPLGAFEFMASVRIQLGSNGKAIGFSDGVGAMTAANGDAFFVSFSGLARQPAPETPRIGRFEGVFTVTGGKGRFVGSSGNGTLTGTVDPDKAQVVVNFEGFVTAPK
jgi:hypothetical protein